MTLTATSVPSSSTALCTCRRAPPPAGRRPPDAADVKGGSRTLVAVAPSPWSPSRDTATEHAATSMLAFLSRDTAKSEKPADTAGTGAGTGVLRQAAGQNLGERGGGDGRLVEAGEERLGAGHSRSRHVTRGVTVSRPQGTQVPTTPVTTHTIVMDVTVLVSLQRVAVVAALSTCRTRPCGHLHMAHALAQHPTCPALGSVLSRSPRTADAGPRPSARAAPPRTPWVFPCRRTPPAERPRTAPPATLTASRMPAEPPPRVRAP